MAAGVLKPIRIHKHSGKDGICIENAVGEAASQTWKAGWPLSRTASTATIVAWPGTTSSSKIIGIAAKDATGVTGAAVPYYEANDYNIFEASMVSGAGDSTLTAAMIGTAYSLLYASPNWYVDDADETTKLVEVIGIIDAIGDTASRVLIRFIGSRQANVLQS